MIRFFQKVWKNTVCRIIIKILLVFGVLCLLYFLTRFFFPALPYDPEDVYDLTESQLRQLVSAYVVLYGRLKYLFLQVFCVCILAILLLYHFFSDTKDEAADLEKELEKQKEKAKERFDSLYEMYEASKNEKKELEEKIKDLQNQLYNKE